MDDKIERLGSRALAQRLIEAIDRGQFTAGQQLPSYRDLAGQYDIAINTAREAIRNLEQQGRVVVQHGRGAFVAEPSSDLAPEQEIHAIHHDLQALRAKLRDVSNALEDVREHLSKMLDRIGRT